MRWAASLKSNSATSSSLSVNLAISSQLSGLFATASSVKVLGSTPSRKTSIEADAVLIPLSKFQFSYGNALWNFAKSNTYSCPKSNTNQPEAVGSPGHHFEFSFPSTTFSISSPGVTVLLTSLF